MGKYADQSSEGGAPYVLWFHFSDTTSQGVAVSVSIVERLCRLTNKIYRDILRIMRHETMTYITIDGRSSFKDIQRGDSSWTPRYRTALSWELLAWFKGLGFSEEIPRSFVEFITTPEISGPEFYIRWDIYHTQVTEYSLETILHKNSL